MRTFAPLFDMFFISAFIRTAPRKRGDSIYPLGVILSRRGTRKHVRRGALAPKGIYAIRTA